MLFITAASLGLQMDLTLKLFLAFFAGILIGLNRSYSGKAAGVRTQMLICVGSALIASISVHLKDLYGHPEAIVRSDPASLMAGIVTGIGFVGGGVILKSDRKIFGVTTAATIWTAAAVGIAIGTGFFLPAFVAVAFVLLLDPLAEMERVLGLKSSSYTIVLPTNHWKASQNTLNRLNIRYALQGENEKHIRLTILTSERKRSVFAKFLRDNGIHYEIDELTP